MRNSIQRSWVVRRNKAIERLVTALSDDGCLSYDEEERISTAADAVTVAHLAAALEWDRPPSKQWTDEEGKAMDRLVRAWTKSKKDGKDDPDLEEELNIALDALAIAHSAGTFEFCSGPLKWRP
jgi:hypothetical protein